MIAIKDFKMPVDCSVCFGRGAIWCRFDESDRIVVPAFPDESLEGRPDWCPLVEVPDAGGNCSEIPNNSDGEYDPKPDIYYLAEKIGIHRLYALVVQLRGEPESCIDTISRQAAVEAIANQSRFSAEEIINICDKSVQDENGWLGGLKESILAVLELPSAQPEQRYTEEELRVFKHGISLSLLSKRSAQYWKYDEDKATEIKFLERLYKKVVANMRGEQDEG